MSDQNGWTAVDLDGTLAVYDGWHGADHIGEPVWPMVHRVRKWLTDGDDVRIFTARVYHDGTPRRMREAADATEAIRAWCFRHLGRELPVTCVKDFAMVVLYDDRCVQVEKNTGRLIGE